MEVEVGVMWCKIGSEFIPREHARKSVRWRRRHRGRATAGGRTSRQRSRPGPQIKHEIYFSIYVATEQQAALKLSRSPPLQKHQLVPPKTYDLR